jgi:hypothetical protein
MISRHRRVFRSLVVLVWVLNLLFFAESVPQELQEEANRSFGRDPTPFLIFLAVACSLGIAKLIAEIGLLLLRRWARPLFAAMLVAGVLAPFLVGVLPPDLARLANVNPPLAESISTLLSTLEGAIIALAYASPVRDLFVPTATEKAARVDSR